jgi:predicted metal-binding membrane protein
MNFEKRPPISGNRRASEVDGGGPLRASDDAHQIAVLIAQKFRDAGVSCELLDPVPTETPFGTLLQRDQIFVALALSLLIAVTWSYLLWLSVDMRMGGMDMTGFRMIPAGMGLMMPAHAPWRAMEFVFVFTMWTVMMVAMMVPSAISVILMYARVGRHAESQRTPLVASAWFVGGYFLVWIVFALLAMLAQWALECAALLDSAMATTSNVLGGFVFVAAGSYQWTRLKDVCLTQCKMPFAFLMRHGGFNHDAPGCVLLGLRYGTYCVGCCWALMMLLFVGGVMNVLWIVLLALLIFLEKVSFLGRQIALLAGIVLVAGGAWLLSMGTF